MEVILMKMAKFLSFIIAIVMVAGVFASCNTTSKNKYTVTYYNGNVKIGDEQVEEGKTATGKVAGYILDGDLYASEDDYNTTLDEDADNDADKQLCHNHSSRQYYAYILSCDGIFSECAVTGQ